jgi:hypothetical protein
LKNTRLLERAGRGKFLIPGVWDEKNGKIDVL